MSNTIDSIEGLMSRIKPHGPMILVKALPLEEVSKSKIIGAEKARESFFNYGRGVIISVSDNVASKGVFTPGMEVYFPPSVATSPNMPNFNLKNDDNYFLVSEGSISYSL
jgi:hypothetical protein